MLIAAKLLSGMLDHRVLRDGHPLARGGSRRDSTPRQSGHDDLAPARAADEAGT